MLIFSLDLHDSKLMFRRVQELSEVPCCYTFRFHVQKLEQLKKRSGSVAAPKQTQGSKQDLEQTVLYLQVLLRPVT